MLALLEVAFVNFSFVNCMNGLAFVTQFVCCL